MKKLLLFVGLCIVVFTVWFYTHHPLTEKVVMNGHTINVEVAVTEQEKEKGLGGRNSLPANAGMLFVYQTAGTYGYWMKGMKFPLDFIWLRGTTVVDLSENIPAPASESEPPVRLAPKAAVDKVLEVNAGTIRAFGIHIGDNVQFTN